MTPSTVPEMTPTQLPKSTGAEHKTKESLQNRQEESSLDRNRSESGWRRLEIKMAFTLVGQVEAEVWPVAKKVKVKGR